MPSLLTTLKNTSELASGEVYLLSALAALQKVVETLPNFVSPYLEGVLLQVSHGDHSKLLGVVGKRGKLQTEWFYLFFTFLVSVWQEGGSS